MASVNKVIIVGYLGRDPQTKTFPSGDTIAGARIATTDHWRDKQTGEDRQSTEWHSVIFQRRLAEIAIQYLRKGSMVYIEGSLRTRKWTDQATGQNRYATEIRAEHLQMLGHPKNRGSQQDESHSDSDYDDGYGAYATPAPAPAPAPANQPYNNQQGSYGRHRG